MQGNNYSVITSRERDGPIRNRYKPLGTRSKVYNSLTSRITFRQLGAIDADPPMQSTPASVKWRLLALHAKILVVLGDEGELAVARDAEAARAGVPKNGTRQCRNAAVVAGILVEADPTELATVSHTVDALAGVAENATLLRPDGTAIAGVLVIAAGRRREREEDDDEDGEEGGEDHGKWLVCKRRLAWLACEFGGLLEAIVLSVSFYTVYASA